MGFIQFFDVVISLLVISNPLILVQAVLGVTVNEKPAHKKKISLLASIIGAGILVVMAVAGTQLLSLLGLKIEAFQIAGGVVVIFLGFTMLNAKLNSVKPSKEEQKSSSGKSGAIIPLAFPLIAGPGAISTVIVDTMRFPGVQNLLLICLACISLGLISWGFMHSAGYLEKKLGATGINIFGRIGGLLLLTLGIQIFLAGLVKYFPLM